MSSYPHGFSTFFPLFRRVLESIVPSRMIPKSRTNGKIVLSRGMSPGGRSTEGPWPGLLRGRGRAAEAPPETIAREQLAAGSNSDYKQTVGRWQWALGSKIANTREQLGKIRHRQAVRYQPLRLCFLNSNLPTAYCLLPTSFPWSLGLPARRAYSPVGTKHNGIGAGGFVDLGRGRRVRGRGCGY